MVRSSSNPYAEPRSLLWIFASAPLLYLFLCTFPGVYEPLGIGLDESWKFALNSLGESRQYLIGRDVNFTYGPLGFLLCPRVVGSGKCFVLAQLFWSFLHISFFVGLSYCLRARLGTLILVLTAFMALCALGLWLELRVVFTVAVFCVLSLRDDPSSLICAAFGSLFACLAFVMKWSLGLAAMPLVLGSWLLLLLWRKQSQCCSQTLRVGISTFALVFVALQAALFDSVASWRQWIAVSSEIARGYGAALSIKGESSALVLALAALMPLLSLICLLSRQPRQSLLLFAVPTLVFFKEGFVRQDGHRYIFFLALTMIPVILLLAPNLRPRDRSCLLLAFGVAFAASVTYASHFQAFPALRRDGVVNFVLLSPGAQNFAALLPSSDTPQRLRLASASNLRSDILPSEWWKVVGHSSVSLLPWEISTAAANGLNWQPIPTLQLYAASTAWLDQLTASAIEKRGAQYLVVCFASLDGRNIIVDNPLVWRSISRAYTVLASDISSQRLLLARKPMPAEPNRLKELSQGQGRFGNWLEIPRQNSPLYASLNVTVSPLGRAAELLYQLPPLYLEIQRASGAASSYRFLSRTAVNAIQIDSIPDSTEDLAELLRGYRSRDPVVRFRIARPHTEPWFHQQYSWSLLSGPGYSIATPAKSSAPLATSISPAEGSGMSAFLKVTASRPSQISDVHLLQVLINDQLTGVAACYLSYEVPQNRLWLIADVGHGSAGVGKPGQETILKTSQCQVPLGQSNVYVSEKEITLTLKIDFQRSFIGSRRIFVWAGESDPKWHPEAIWRVN